MAEKHRTARVVLRGPLLTWGALLLLGAVSLTYAMLPGLPFKPAASLAIFVVQASLVAGAFMQIGRASALVKMTAAAGLLWLSFLFLLAFADLWTR